MFGIHFIDRSQWNIGSAISLHDTDAELGHHAYYYKLLYTKNMEKELIQ